MGCQGSVFCGTQTVYLTNPMLWPMSETMENRKNPCLSTLMEMWYDRVETGYGGWKMYVQLTMAERLKDLRVIDKKLTLEQLA